MSRRRYGLTDHEWAIIEPLLPNKPRGVPRVDDRRVLNGILWRFRTGSPWAEIPQRYGPYTTCYNRFVRWRKAGVWDRLLDAVSDAYEKRPWRSETPGLISRQSPTAGAVLRSPGGCTDNATMSSGSLTVSSSSGASPHATTSALKTTSPVRLIAVRIWCQTL